jgi:hypothetical protein
MAKKPLHDDNDSYQGVERSLRRGAPRSLLDALCTCVERGRETGVNSSYILVSVTRSVREQIAQSFSQTDFCQTQ